jgi:glutathione peroxidase
MLYDIAVTTSRDEQKTLHEYEGKVLLIVNTASKCGFTPQFEGLQSLYDRYKDQGLEIVGFPCNQFREQDPGTNEEIESFCQLNYGVTFPIFAKVDVKGANAHPLFKYLTKHAPGFLTNTIKWNFTKFLIDRSGKVIKRYAPTTEPRKIETAIEQLLHNGVASIG